MQLAAGATAFAIVTAIPLAAFAIVSPFASRRWDAGLCSVIEYVFVVGSKQNTR